MPALPHSARKVSTGPGQQACQHQGSTARGPAEPTRHIIPAAPPTSAPVPAFTWALSGSIGFDLESDTGKLKSSSALRAAEPGESETHRKRLTLARCSGFGQEVRTELGRKDWNRLGPGSAPGAPRGQAWLLDLEVQAAALQQVEGSPRRCQAGERRGSHSLSTLFLASSHPEGPSTCPLAMGRGAG